MTQANFESFFKYSGGASRSGEGTRPVILNDLLKLLRYRDISLWKFNFSITGNRKIFGKLNFFLTQANFENFYYILVEPLELWRWEPPPVILNDLHKLLRYRDISLWIFNFLLPVIQTFFENLIFFYDPGEFWKFFLYSGGACRTGEGTPCNVKWPPYVVPLQRYKPLKIQFSITRHTNIFWKLNFFLWPSRILKFFYRFW